MAGVTAAQVLASAQARMDRPWEWGVADCCTSVADVVIDLYGVDPMAPGGGRIVYGSQEDADALASGAGGFVALVTMLAEAAGFFPFTGPAWPGDVGVTAAGVHHPDRRALAVNAGPGVWVAKSPRGYTIVSSVERAWRWGG